MIITSVTLFNTQKENYGKFPVVKYLAEQLKTAIPTYPNKI